jgi:hypothetical protein
MKRFLISASFLLLVFLPGVAQEEQRFGVQVVELDEKLAELFRVNCGLLVAEVEPGSIAEKAGVARWDILQQVKTGDAVKPLKSRKDLLSVVPDIAGGKDFSLEVSRCGKSVTLPVKEKVSEPGGYRLLSGDDADIWWVEATYNVLADARAPATEGETIEVAACKNEIESFQLVIRPKKDLESVQFRVIKEEGKEAPEWLAFPRISLVEFVEVKVPTDRWGKTGKYPDPLPMLRDFGPGESGGRDAVKALSFKADEARAVFFSFKVPKNASAGDHLARVEVVCDGKTYHFPLKFHIFDFALTDETHTRTAYGIHIDNTWHALKEGSEFEKVYDLYLRNFAEHRVSPCDLFTYHPIAEKRVGDKVEYDFTEFDAQAKRCFEEYHFNSFNFPIPGTKDAGFDEEYKKLFRETFLKKVAHLEEKGWLRYAYCYWIDEPRQEKYEFVKSGLALLKDECPGLKRLLTLHIEKAPNKTFEGLVNLWVPCFHCFDPAASRKAKGRGEEVWWYVCTIPRSPYPNNFIDYPAIDHRIRFWMLQKYGIDGDLYWTTTFYDWRNPYEDAMSYADSEHTLGNGDGCLLYPPSREKPEKPLIAGPVNSLRWEMIREGLEDREYFYLLEQELDKLQPADARRYRILNEIAKDALALPDVLIRSQRDYERDYRQLHRAREFLGWAVELLTRANK